MTLDLITFVFLLFLFVQWSMSTLLNIIFRLGILVLAMAFLIRHVDALRGLL